MQEIYKEDNYFFGEKNKMSNLSTLKVFTATYVAESDLSNYDKLWLIDFIKEGEYNDIIDILQGEYQLPQISEQLAEELFEGIIKVAARRFRSYSPKMVKGKNFDAATARLKAKGRLMGDEEAKRLAKRMKKGEIPSSQKPPPIPKPKSKSKGYNKLKAAGTAGGVALAAAGGHSMHQKYMSHAAKACKGKPDTEICMAKYKKKAAGSKNIIKIKKLRVAKNDCINTRNPLKCRQRLDSKIKKLKEDVDFVMEAGMEEHLIFYLFLNLDLWHIKDFFQEQLKHVKDLQIESCVYLDLKYKQKKYKLKRLNQNLGCVQKMQTLQNVRTK